MLEYFKLICKHKYYVFIFGLKLKVPLLQLLIHDISKFGPSEYKHYQRWFFVDKNDPDGFAAAWLHHKNHNPHHWEYWLQRTKRKESGQTLTLEPLPMPEKYIRELVADWIAAGKAYKNALPLQEWLNKEWKELFLHEKTKGILRKVLKECNVSWPGDVQ